MLLFALYMLQIRYIMIGFDKNTRGMQRNKSKKNGNGNMSPLLSDNPMDL